MVCANKRGFPQLEMMNEYYGGTDQNGIYTINGIDICTALTEPEKQYNVQMPSDQLFIKGAAFALRAGGRSPRVAKQFVELLAAGVKV